LFVANWEYYTQTCEFTDVESLPIVAHCWKNILNVIDIVRGCYMMYTNALDYITQKQVSFQIVLLSSLILFDDSHCILICVETFGLFGSYMRVMR
jgi:hypothetical protein